MIRHGILVCAAMALSVGVAHAQAPPPVGTWGTGTSPAAYEILTVGQNGYCQLKGSYQGQNSLVEGACQWQSTSQGGILTIMNIHNYQPAPNPFQYCLDKPRDDHLRWRQSAKDRELTVSEGYIALAVAIACCLAYRQAVRTGQWSSRAFGWILLLLWGYIGACLAIGYAIIFYAGDDKLIFAGLPFLIGFIPVVIMAKRIQRRYQRQGDRHA